MVLKLVRTDSIDAFKIPLSVGEHLFGRGKLLGCDDKRISRNHGQLDVFDSHLIIKALHQNPCFYMINGTDNKQILNKDSSVTLNNGDKFGLLPDAFWYEVLHCTEPDSEHTDKDTEDYILEHDKSNDSDTRSNDQTINNCYAQLPLPSTTNDTEEPNCPTNSANVESNPNTSNENVFNNGVKDNETNCLNEDSDKTAAKRSHSDNIDEQVKKIKREPPDDNTEQHKPGSNDPVVNIKTESNEVTEPSEMKTEPSEVKTEPSDVKTEPSDVKTEPNEVKSEQDNAAGTSGQGNADGANNAPNAAALNRERCMYGDKCYRTPYDHTAANQSYVWITLPTDLLPQPPRNDAEAEDVAASKSARSVAKKQTTAKKKTTAAPLKSKAEKQREYRQRKAATRTAAEALAARKSDTERKRKSRQRQAATSAPVGGLLPTTTASSSRSGARSREARKARSPWATKWASAIMRFESTFLDNDFGHACSVCDRLWFKNELKPITTAQLDVISERCVVENRRMCREEYVTVCNTCKRTLNKRTMPPLAKINGFSYPERPPGLPPLDPISERLISPRLPFVQVRRLRRDSSCGIVVQAINVSVDGRETVKRLPRRLDEDDVINVNVERNVAHESVYLGKDVSDSTIGAWLAVLRESPLYRLYEIEVDLSRLDPPTPLIDDDSSDRIENISAENAPTSEVLASRQHTVMWNEQDCLDIAPGHQPTPVDVVNDRHAEELSFPSIYFGEPRKFSAGIALTPYMIAKSEIRRRDRRGAAPQKILYVAMRMLRQRIVNGIHGTFRSVADAENVTRRMLEDTEFLKEYVIQNLAFMKTVPNSVQYWAARKRDLFAMIRQLGKPTAVLTIGANEIRWTKLLTILLKLSKKYPGKTAKELDASERCTLVSDDPVACCIYFHRLVGSLMKMLKSKQSYNPFGKYLVKDHFVRIEFRHRGSPRAHVLLWLNDDPRETASDNMPRTIDLVEKLSSVARDDVPNDSIYANQIHEHTFACTEGGETTCGIPYWPMPATRVLVPIPQADERLQVLRGKAEELRSSLCERRYACMDEFLDENGLTLDSYLDVVRSTLHRPTLMFRRNFDELATIAFNPYLVGEVDSRVDIQFILDDYGCAECVVEFVNRSARGSSDLRRELTAMMREHPDRDYTGQLKALSDKLLNGVEMSAQEAAWYLLGQPMSETSRPVVYIPTVWPAERQRCRKRRIQMEREGLDADSTDIWTKNIIQRYEERPASLERVYLAEFASWYANANDFVDDEDDVPVDDDDDSEAAPEARTSRAPREYRRRAIERVIRYRRYDVDETVDYKREMVLLYVEFRNEISEILDQNKFLQLFDDNEDMIMERRSLFETNSNIENVTKELSMSTY